ncbi:MAG TPA: hypothetical protein PLM98_11340, partial [Thiolinea sp.]|nr:hypothetical protein [Thiolinea sp.]
SKIKPKPRLLAQQEAVSVWLPFYDRIVALMLETLQNGQPCQVYPLTWKQRAQGLLTEYRQLKAQHKLCLKHTDQTSYQYQLREFMRRCASAPAELTERELGRVRFILNSYIAKRGAPQSAQHLAARQEQLKTISQATLQQLARVVLERLGTQLTDRGLDNLEPILQAITPSEAEQHRIMAGLAIPKAIRRKVQRCQIDSLTKLLETGLIGSGEVLAKVLPQITASLQAVSMTDARIRQLYAALYQSFRKRRSVYCLI